MTETLPSEGQIEMVTSRTGMKKADGAGDSLIWITKGMCRWTGYGF